MPSKLPIIKANTTPENIQKMKFIAKYNKRSLAKELESIIEEHITRFENEHGEIVVKDESAWNTQMKLMKTQSQEVIKHPIKILKESTKNGIEFGNTLAEELTDNRKGKDKRK